MIAGNGAALFDANGNPLAALPNTALASPQAAIVNSGSDYAPSPKAQIVKVDASGSQYVVTSTPSGASTMVNTGQAAGAAATQFGNLMMGRMDSPAPSIYSAVTLDSIGSLQVHQKSKATFSAIALNVTCGTNVILFAMQNTGTMIIRLQKVSIYIPPAGGSGGALLGSSGGQSYYPVFCELRRAATFTGGTAINPVPSDSADVLAPGLTCARTATAITGTPSLLHQADAYATNVTGLPWLERGADANAKTVVLRPGECVYVVCTSNGVVNSTVAGANNVVAQANIIASFTQAVA